MGLDPLHKSVSLRNFAHWNMADALEAAIDEPQHIRRTEIFVPAAANWILVAGKVLLDLCRRGIDSEQQVFNDWHGGPYVGKTLWYGTNGFDMSRWEFWKKRFGEIVQLPAKENVVDLSMQAMAEMERLESCVEESDEMDEIEAGSGLGGPRPFQHSW